MPYLLIRGHALGRRCPRQELHDAEARAGERQARAEPGQEGALVGQVIPGRGALVLHLAVREVGVTCWQCWQLGTVGTVVTVGWGVTCEKQETQWLGATVG